MDKSSRFLPERVSRTLKGLAMRVFGIALVVLGFCLVIALIFHNPYLDGFGAASSFGEQSILGQVAGFVRYGVGFVPALFLFLCVIRGGFALVANWGRSASPEYNLLRGFIALFVGASGFGLLMPGKTFGGMAGAIVASDLVPVIGTLALPLGLVCVAVFLVMGGVLLHIKWSHVVACVRKVWRSVRWLLSVFHLTNGQAVGRSASQSEDEVEEDSENQNTESAGEEKMTRRQRKQAEKQQKQEEKKNEKKEKSSSAKATGAATFVAKGAGAVRYELPDPKFLKRSEFGKNVITPELKRNAAAMEVHFAEYGVNGKVVGIKPGPIVTLYEFMPVSGTKWVDINKTVRDMTRAMATASLRIAQIPASQLIGVEMVNIKPNTVRFQSLMDDPAFVESKYRIPLALGVSIGGNPMYFDLAKMPHMLVAGRTGSGKSVFVQSIILSILYHFTPDKCKLMIIDPKGVDFGFWDDIPHLITPIVKLDPVPAVNALKWSVREMEERYKRLGTMGVQNIEAYNKAVVEKRESGEKVTKQVAVGTDEVTGELLFETQEVDLSDMPYLVIIIDEVADLMGVARKEVEASVQRLAQKARAAGIHLVMATQRPDATTITGVIKANFPTRISFQARSHIDSMTTLGEKGAENLLACGDMLFSEAGKPPVRIHGALIENDEMIKVANFLRTQGEPEYTEGVTDADDSGMGGMSSAQPSAQEVKASKNADLYEQAKEYVLRDKKPTISYVQRRVGVGYNKAAGFIERMEQEGLISPADATGKRHIL